MHIVGSHILTLQLITIFIIASLNGKACGPTYSCFVLNAIVIIFCSMCCSSLNIVSYAFIEHMYTKVKRSSCL
jgi:hypothetical protein